jgi:CHAD domain-containing protein
MSYKINLSKNIEEEVKNVIDSQLVKILHVISNEKISEDKKIHKIRKILKKIRALLKLIKYDLKDKDIYTAQNEYYKNAGKVFSQARDNTVLVKTFDKIIEKFDLDRDKYTNPIQYLENTDNQENFTMLRKEIKQIRKTLWIYQLKKKKKPLKKGLKKIYKKLQKRKKRAYKTHSDTDFHEWRKAVKNYMYQLKLLKKNLPKKAKKTIKKIKELADILGFDHDISVLKGFLLSKNINDPLVKYLEKEQKYLRKKASKIKIKGFAKKWNS